jgi:outer membrane protein TolC
MSSDARQSSILPRRETPRFLRGAAALALVLAAARIAPAQGTAAIPEQPVLTLVEAARMALASHPSIGAADAVGAQARASIRSAAAARWPALELSAAATRYQEPMLVTPLHGLTVGQDLPFDRTLFQGALGAGYMLFDGGVRGARIDYARAQAAATDAALDGATQMLLAHVTATYLDVLAQSGTADAHDRRIAALESEQSRVKQRYAVGRAPELELLRIEAALAHAEADRVTTVEALAKAEHELARLVGTEPAGVRAGALAPVMLVDSTLPVRDALMRSAVAASPATEAARRQLAAAEAGIAVASGARWPKLRLNAGYIQRGSANTDSWGEWSAGTSVTIPLFTGGANSAELARARAGRREAAERLRLAELEAAANVDRALAAVAEMRARVASLTTAVDRFAEVARTEKLALDVGSGTQTDYLDAEADLLAARAGLADARAREIVARTELARTTGQLSVAWMAHVLEVTP